MCLPFIPNQLPAFLLSFLVYLHASFLWKPLTLLTPILGLKKDLLYESAVVIYNCDAVILGFVNYRLVPRATHLPPSWWTSSLVGFTRTVPSHFGFDAKLHTEEVE